MGERHLDTVEVGGSIPLLPTITASKSLESKGFFICYRKSDEYDTGVRYAIGDELGTKKSPPFFPEKSVELVRRLAVC